MLKRFMWFLVFASGLLVSVDASASQWRCTVRFDLLPAGKATWELTKATTAVDATDKTAASIAAIKKVIAEHERVHGIGRAVYNARRGNAHYALCNPDTRPSPPKPIAPKPSAKLWTCRVQLTWHVGKHSGSVDETWSDIEAASEAQAMGLAIQRSQNRLKALTLAGTNPTWGKTDVSCS